MDKWDQRFLNLANEIASWSKDPNKQVGAVVISPDKRRVSYGYNGFPKGVQDDVRLMDRATKNSLTVHAEVNAILNAKADLTGWCLYATKMPCLNCALYIAQSGISRVVCPALDEDSNWHLLNLQALDLFRESGITVTFEEQ